MPYQRINWKNGEAGGTPLNESNLNKMDSQIAQNVADIDELKNKPGGAMLVLTNASPLPATDSKPILGIDAKGNSTQNGTPTPTNPIEIIDASTEVVAKSEDGTQSNTITLPYTLKSVGNVADELVVNEDGSGKIVQRVFEYRLPSSNAWALLETKTNTLRFVIANVLSAVNTECMCEYFKPTTQVGMGKIDEPSICVRDDLKGIAVMIDKATASTKEQFLAWLNSNEVMLHYCATPIETPLTAEQVASIRQLQTYKGTTVIDSEMDVASVSYSGDVKGYVDSKTDYSYTDQIIGKWADGKDLHRIVVNTNTPSSSGGIVIPFLNGNNCDIKNMYGFINWTSDTKVPINYYSTSANFATTYPSTNGIVMSMGNSLISKPCEIIVEYTLKEESGIALLSDEGEVVADE